MEGCRFNLAIFISPFFLGAPRLEAFGSHRSSSGKVEKLQGQGRRTGEVSEVFPKLFGGIPHK